MAQKTSAMKTYAFIVTVLLLLSGGAIWYLIDRNKAEQANRYGDNLRLQGVIESVREEAAGRIAQKQAVIDSAKAKAFRDSVQAKSRERGLKMRLAAYLARAGELQPIVQGEIDANPDLSELIDNKDWALITLDSLLKHQELACHEQIQGRDQIIRMQSYQVESALALAEAEKQRGDGEEQAKNRAVKGKKFWQVMAGIAAGVIAVLSLK
jgi:hypothetical protein